MDHPCDLNMDVGAGTLETDFAAQALHVEVREAIAPLAWPVARTRRAGWQRPRRSGLWHLQERFRFAGGDRAVPM